MASLRSRSFYESDEDYSNKYDSDDFASEDDIVSIKQPAKPPAKKSNPYVAAAKPKGRGRGKGRTSQSTKQSTPKPGNSSVANRMISASRIRMNEYRNQMEEQNEKIIVLMSENKTLKKMQFRHERALGKFEDKEGELPQLLTRHTNEVRALREQNRKFKNKYSTTDRYLRDAEDELDMLKIRLNKYKTLAEKKGLLERDELSRKVQQAEIELEEKDSRIKELERHIDKLNKNHRHEIGIEMAHHRETKKQFKELENKHRSTQESLREKGKELDVQNIYSNRIMKVPHRLPNSYNGTPHHTPPARRKRNPSLTDLSSKDKAKLYEDKRREEDKHTLESPRRTKKPKETWKADKDQPLDTSQNIQFTSYEKQIKNEEEADSWVERERERVQREKNEQKEKEEQQIIEDMKQQRERMKRESEEIKRLEKEREERMREEDRRIKSDIEEERINRVKKAQQDKEQIERERREREEMQRERREEEDRIKREREKEVQERQAEADRERLKNDPKVIEERRKKDLLLARMKQIDTEKPSEPFAVSNSPQRATFIASNKENSFNSHSPGLESNTSTKSAYSFTKPIENMHHGLPSHEDVTIPPYLERQRKIKSQKEDLEIGGYQPSFARNTYNSDSLKPKSSNSSKHSISKNDDFRKTSIHGNPDRKTKLLNDLFGNKTEDTNSSEDIFNVSSSKNSSTKQSGFPWDDKPKANQNQTPKRENTSTLFGGGTALVDEEDGEIDTSKLLPRRIRQPTSTFSSKPAVSAIDHIDDELEEVII